jgi:hypothetical protein
MGFPVAKDFDARLSIVHVIPSIGHGLSTDFSSRLKQNWEEMAREEVQKLQRNGLVESVSVFIREGDVTRSVLFRAFDRGRFGGHRTGRSRAPDRTIENERLRDKPAAPCPVLSV